MKDFLIDVGRTNGDERYVLNLKNENAFAIAGFSGTGKTNFLNYLKSQILVSDNVKISNFTSRIYLFDKVLENHFGSDTFKSYLRNKKARVEIKKYVKDIESRLNKISKKNCDFDTYLHNHVKEKDIDKFKYHFIIIDDFSVELFKMKSSDLNAFNEYLTNLKYIIEHGKESGYFLILSGYRCKNGDFPVSLTDLISCKLSFKNPKDDYVDWNLLTELNKTPNRIGECLIRSNSLSQSAFVKTYSLNKYIDSKSYIFNNSNLYSSILSC